MHQTRRRGRSSTERPTRDCRVRERILERAGRAPLLGRRLRGSMHDSAGLLVLVRLHGLVCAVVLLLMLRGRLVLVRLQRALVRFWDVARGAVSGSGIGGDSLDMLENGRNEHKVKSDQIRSGQLRSVTGCSAQLDPVSLARQPLLARRQLTFEGNRP